MGLTPGLGRSPREGNGNPCLGRSHRHRSLAGYSPWGCRRVRHDLATKQQRQPVAASLGAFRMVTHLADVSKLEVCGWGRTGQHSTQKEPILFNWFCGKAWVTSHTVFAPVAPALPPLPSVPFFSLLCSGHKPFHAQHLCLPDHVLISGCSSGSAAD